MKQKLRIFGVLLALCLTLTACGGKQDGPAQMSGTAAYTADIFPLDLPVTELTASGALNGSLYLAGLEEEPVEEDGEFSSSFTSSFTSDDSGVTVYSGGMGRAVLYRMDAAAGDLVKLEGYVPGDGASIDAVVPCEDGSLWVLERTGSGMEAISAGGIETDDFTIGPGSFGVTSRVWRKLNAAGDQELERIDISDLTLGTETAAATRMDREGRLYAASGSTVTVLDAGLSTLFTCKALDPVEQLVSLSDGSVGAVTGDSQGRTVYPVDPSGQTLGEARPLTGNAEKIYDGNGTYDFLYSSGDSLYGWAASAPEKLLSWSGAGLDKGQVAALALLPDGQGAAVLREDMWPVSFSLARMAPAGEEALAGRTVLRLATMGLDSETRAQVLEFNRTSSTHRIEVQDYSELNTAGDNTAGLSRLNTEILAGNMPDLLDVSGVPLRRYAARGLLEDLWPYIESDPELGREGVMERPLEAAALGGKLYQVFSRFCIETAAGAPSAVGDRMGWTLEELRAALAKQPAGCDLLDQYETRDSILETMFSNNMDRFVNWSEGTASFDSPDFQEILEFCSAFPAQARNEEYVDAYTRVARGEQLLLPVSLSDLTSLQLYRTLFGGGAAFVGYPGTGGSGVRFSFDHSMAMSASCKDKDGAWSFLRQTLLPGEEQFMAGTGSFAVNRAGFEREAAESMEITYARDENGNLITGADGEPILMGTAYLIIGSQLVELKPPTQEDYDQVMALYEAADGIVERDENIWAIVQECAGAFFAGDRTAEDAAKAIQSRVELYLNEQR